MAPPDLKEPPRWRMDHLERANAMNVGAVKPPSLTNDLSPLFARARWEVTDVEYATLTPSLHLASHWLEVAMPYLATFLPSNRLHQELKNSEDNSVIEVRKDVTEQDLRAARAELAEISKTTRWQLDWAMRSNNGWLGITRTTPQERPWGVISSEDIKRWDRKAKQEGLKRRPLIVGIMKEYVMALQANAATSEIYLRAAFMAACTIFHEVGHVVWLQDFRAWHSENVEPWVGDAAWAELGLSLGARVFDGYNPIPADLPNRWWYNFNTPLYWDKINTTTTKPTPWKAINSISIDYMQDCFADSFWATLGDVDFSWSRRARVALNPSNKKYPEPAISMQIQFGKWDDVGGDDEDFDAPGNEEIKLAWKKQPYDRTMYGNKSVWQWLTPEDRNWIQGKGPRLIDPATGIETTGDRDQQQRDEDAATAQKSTGEESVAEFKFSEVRETTRPKFESLIEPIMLDQDVQLPNEVMEDPKYQKIVQIRVKYRSEIGTDSQPTSYTSSILGSNKRARLPNDEGPSSKKPKPTSFPTSSNESAVRNARKTLDHWAIERMERNLNHQKAFELCQQMNVEFGTYYDNAQWQLEKLNYDKQTDKYLMERIRLAAFSAAGKKYTGDSADQIQALLELTIELANSILNWGPIAAKDFCRISKLKEDGTPKQILARIAKVFRLKIEALATKLEQTFHLNEKTNPDVEEEEYLRMLSARNTRASDDFINTFIKNKRLPAWGNAQCKGQRVENFRWTKNTGNYPHRKTEDRTFDGVETYVFTCNPHSTTVESLLSSLYIEGCFPHNAHLALLKDNKYAGGLNEAHNTLADALHWGGESVIDLQLQVVHPKLPVHGTEYGDNEPQIYQPRNVLPVSKRTTDPALERKADIIVGKAVPTVAERLKHVKEFGDTLNAAFVKDGGKDVLRPHKRVAKTQSGGIILENLKDISDEKDRFLEAMEVGGMIEDDVEEIEYGNEIEAVSGSYMADMYKSL